MPPEDSATPLAQWRGVLAEALPADERVLYAQAEPDEVVAQLRAAGVDAYGVTEAGSPHRPGPDVRFADLLEHLRAVPDGALGAVVLAGLPEAMSPVAVGPLVAELGRVTQKRRDHLRGTVVVAPSARSGGGRSGAGPTARPRHVVARLPRRGHGRAPPSTTRPGRSYRVVVRARE